MNPLAASFHDDIVAFDPNKRSLVESLLSSAAKGYGEKSFEKIQAEASTEDDFWGEEGTFLSMIRPYVVKNGLLLIPVKGVLLNDFPYQFGPYATGYTYIWKAFERGLDDPDVKGIALVINSPGGTVAQCFDVVDKMFSYRGAKPVRAFAHESAYSAAYAIASVADKIVVSRTGGVGSIGVLTTHVSYEEAYKKMGIEVTYIFAGEHKVDGNPFEKLGKAVKDRIQVKIDSLYEVFVSTVARNRDMDEKAVRDTKASTFMANEAVSNGLADEIGTLDDATEAFASELEAEDDDTMARTTDQQKHYDEGQKDANAAHTSALDTLKTEHAAALATASTAARQRISGILACDNAKDRPKAAMNCAMKTDMTVEAANDFLKDMPVESAAAPEKKDDGKKEGEGNDTNTAAKNFGDAMNKADHPNIEQPSGKDPKDKPSRAAAALALAGTGVVGGKENNARH